MENCMMHFGKRKSARSLEKLKVTGNIQIDSALERHQFVEDSARSVNEEVRAYLGKIRELTTASASVTQSLTAYFAGSTSEGRIRSFATLHDKADREVPDVLLKIANEHILAGLDKYMANLDEIREEIKVFHERQSTFDHYEKKVHKLEDEKRKRQSDSKSEKPKHIEKLTRNAKKKQDAMISRNEIVTSLLNKLNYIYETRTTTMEPIFRHLFQFQQEYFKQTALALDGTLPASSPTSASSTTAPVVPNINTSVAGGSNKFQFDAHGNRIPSPGTSPVESTSSQLGHLSLNAAPAPPPPPPPHHVAQPPVPNRSSVSSRPPAPLPISYPQQQQHQNTFHQDEQKQQNYQQQWNGEASPKSPDEYSV